MITKAKGDFINGKFVRPKRPDEAIVSVDPGNRSTVVGEFPVKEDHVASAVDAAKTAFTKWAAVPIEKRAAAIRRIRAQLTNNSKKLIELIALETGRPTWEARTEIKEMLERLDGMLKVGVGELGMRHRLPAGVELEFRPIGVVAVLSPHPQAALILHSDTIAALLAGCTVVCKPSHIAPAVAQLYAQLIAAADLPKGVFNLVQGHDGVGSKLVAHPDVSAVLFCGRQRTKAAIHRSLATRPTDTEFGNTLLRTISYGLSATIVGADANIDEAAYGIMIGLCASAGQRCTTTRRVIAHKRIYGALTKRLAALSEGMNVGHSSDRTSFMGPMVSERVYRRFSKLTKALGERYELISSGSVKKSDSAPDGAFVRPTIVGVPAACASQTWPEEGPDGPILSVCQVPSLEAAIDELNSVSFGIVNAVYSRSKRAFDAAQASLRGGSLVHNTPTTQWPGHLPLHPYGSSGSRMAWGVLTVRLCTHVVTSVGKPSAFDTTMIPPGLPKSTT